MPLSKIVYIFQKLLLIYLFVFGINNQSRVSNNLGNQTIFVQFPQTEFGQRSSDLHSFRANSRGDHLVAWNFLLKFVPSRFVEQSGVLKLISDLTFGPLLLFTFAGRHGGLISHTSQSLSLFFPSKLISRTHFVPEKKKKLKSYTIDVLYLFTYSYCYYLLQNQSELLNRPFFSFVTKRIKKQTSK